MPAPGKMVLLSPAYNPIVLKGIKIDPNNPFRFHFYVDTGDVPPSFFKEGDRGSLKKEASRLIKYFLTSLTIPEKDLWVNLSPYEKDRIIPPVFGQTEMGRDLLAQDYILKQITASLIYPESHLGKKFWQKVYAQAQAKYGTTNVPINTFNKVWIVPEKAVVYEKKGVAFILASHLKVMLEQDYLSMQKHNIPPLFYKEGIRGSSKSINTLSALPLACPYDTSSIGANIIRQIVIPALTKEVNEGKNFAQLRQVFYSLILATWYKKKIKDSILNKVYSNRNKIQNLSYHNDPKNLSSPNALGPQTGHSQLFVGDPAYIYQQYLKAFKKGVYNYIKEEPDPATNQTTPRKYFSGGIKITGVRRSIKIESQLNRVQTSNLAMLNVMDMPVVLDLMQARMTAANFRKTNYKADDNMKAKFIKLLEEKGVKFLGIIKDRQGINIGLKIGAPVGAPWVMDHRRDPRSGRIITDMNQVIEAKLAAGIEYYPILSKEGDSVLCLGLAQIGGIWQPVLVKLFGKAYNGRTEEVEIINMQIASRIGFSPQFYGIIRDNRQNLIGYAMQLIIGEKYDRIKHGGKPDPKLSTYIRAFHKLGVENIFGDSLLSRMEERLFIDVVEYGDISPENFRFLETQNSEWNYIEGPSFAKDMTVSAVEGSNAVRVNFKEDTPQPAALHLRMKYRLRASSAMKTRRVTDGGIDFNPAQMSMQVAQEGEDFKFNFNGAKIDAAQITGATFNIRPMTRVTNLSAVLGFNSRS